MYLNKAPEQYAAWVGMRFKKVSSQVVMGVTTPKHDPYMYVPREGNGSGSSQSSQGQIQELSKEFWAASWEAADKSWMGQ
jgi:hypothetical protein